MVDLEPNLACTFDRMIRLPFVILLFFLLLYFIHPSHVVFLRHHPFMIGILLHTWLSVFIYSKRIHIHPSIRLYVHSMSISIYSIHPSMLHSSQFIPWLPSIQPSILHPSLYIPSIHLSRHLYSNNRYPYISTPSSSIHPYIFHPSSINTLFIS